MNLSLAQIPSCLKAGLAILCLSAVASAQSFGQDASPLHQEPAVTSNVSQSRVLTASVELPDAPQPQDIDSGSDSFASSQTPQSASPATSQPETPQDQRDLAAQQLKQQQKQRVLGIVPNFNTSYVYGAAPLSAKQKFSLAFRSEIDPAAFGISGFVALIEQAEGSHYAYGGGWGGYGKRYGQTYADSFDGQMIGNAILPSLLHQDPRYFRLGRGPAKRRILYALGTNVIAHHDGTGRWEPNYSNVLGNFAAGGISNIYLPANERGFGSTITGGLVVLAEGGAGSMFQEFWPDIARHYLHRDPTDGQDARNKLLPDPNAGQRLFHNPPKKPESQENSQAYRGRRRRS